MKSVRRFVTSLFCAAGLILAGCVGFSVEELTPQPLFTDTPTATVTPSVIWFPPNPTSRPMSSPTPLPTVDYRPGVGEVVFRDVFDRRTGWQLNRNEIGSSAFGKNELTLAFVPDKKGSIASLGNTPAFDDFAMEITTNLSLCRGAGEIYGLLVRAASAQDFYRLLISCSGELRMERVLNSRVAILQDWTPSGQVRPGAPLLLRVGIWALRGEMRVFINGAYQFSVTDTFIRQGVIGVFARSAGQSPFTVSFSDLEVSALNIQPTPTPPPPTLTPPGFERTQTAAARTTRTPSSP